MTKSTNAQMNESAAAGFIEERLKVNLQKNDEDYKMNRLMRLKQIKNE
jgi:hypothetical protein